MPATYVGKAKVVIPSIDKERTVPCILVDVTVWLGPLVPGATGHHSTERHAIPIGQASLAPDGTLTPNRTNSVRSYDPVTGQTAGTISKGINSFHDAIGKRLSFGKLPI